MIRTAIFMAGYFIGILVAIILFRPYKQWEDGFEKARKHYLYLYDEGYRKGFEEGANYDKDASESCLDHEEQYRSCDNCYYEYFDDKAYPCSRCDKNADLKDMWQKKIRACDSNRYTMKEEHESEVADGE